MVTRENLGWMHAKTKKCLVQALLFSPKREFPLLRSLAVDGKRDH